MSNDTYGLGDPLMLERIDKLIACNIGTLIDLPQIVVVGDQSSGKSSVLAGLIRKSLPRDSGLCTRFATHIIFRRSDHESISASIIPAEDSSNEHRAAVEAWRMDMDSLDEQTFSRIMTEAHDVMGLGSVTEASNRSTFSNDIFRLEISGPDQEHLSVIDVPGIFKNTTPGLTTKADIELVKSMVLSYMENPRSVLLAVIPANVDVATQEILELASDVDPEGDRTLGVLTKPDLVDKGTEGRVIDLVEGRARPMKLGWHIVRNPGQQHLSDTSLDRNTLEMDFFRANSVWKDIDKEKIGVETLRGRLQEVLSTLVRKEFPKVKQEINKLLRTREKSLKDIGPERSSTQTQTAYLTDLATRFQRLVMLSLNAKYGADELFERFDALRLAPAITARDSAFSEIMAREGHTYAFQNAASLEAKSGKESRPGTATGNLDTHSPWPTVTSKLVKKALPKTMSRIVDEEGEADLEDILHPKTEIDTVNETEMESWLEAVYNSSRGFELGTFDASILATTMKKQSSKWCDISLGYISDVVVIVHRFTMTALDALCFDLDLKTALVAALTDGLLHRYRKAIQQVQFLLEVERNGTPMTANHYFNDNLEKCRQARMHAEVIKHSFSDCSHGEVVRLEDIMYTHPMSNTNHIVQEIHDILQSYYKLGRKRFVDSVLKQATDHFLIQGPDTPLAFFSPNFVSNLDPAELSHIAGEAPRTLKTRSRLNKEIASLNAAKNILARG